MLSQMDQVLITLMLVVIWCQEQHQNGNGQMDPKRELSFGIMVQLLDNMPTGILILAILEQVPGLLMNPR